MNSKQISNRLSTLGKVTSFEVRAAGGWVALTARIAKGGRVFYCDATAPTVEAALVAVGC